MAQLPPGIPIDTILGAIPDDLKPSGLQKIPQLIMAQGLKIDTLIQPALDSAIKELPEDIQPPISEILPKLISQVQGGGNINPDDFINVDDIKSQVYDEVLARVPIEEFCLPPDVTNRIIEQRNNIVDILNKVGKQLDILSATLGLATGFLGLVQIIIRILGVVDIGLLLTSIYLPPTAGKIANIRQNLSTFKDTVIFDKDGESRITPILQSLGSAAISVSVVNSFVKVAVNTLFIIDPFIETCGTKAQKNNLTKLSPTIQGIFEIQSKSLQTANQSTYKGFVIQIVEEPYTPTVNRRRAVGLNQYGIQQIKTDLSFTTNNQTLIDELKFIIDRDNLKAD